MPRTIFAFNGDLESRLALYWLVNERGCEVITLSINLGQHLFDTLYHAVALDTPEAVLVTADQRYLRAAQRRGRICALRDWRGPD